MQPPKASESMLVTLLGMIMFVRLSHHLKVATSMRATPFGIVTLVILQPIKAPMPILVTLFGIVMFVRLMHA